MKRALPLCRDCRYLDLHIKNNRSIHWCVLKRRPLSDLRVRRRACRAFAPWPALDEAPCP